VVGLMYQQTVIETMQVSLVISIQVNKELTHNTISFKYIKISMIALIALSEGYNG